VDVKKYLVMVIAIYPKNQIIISLKKLEKWLYEKGDN